MEKETEKVRGEEKGGMEKEVKEGKRKKEEQKGGRRVKGKHEGGGNTARCGED